MSGLEGDQAEQAVIVQSHRIVTDVRLEVKGLSPMTVSIVSHQYYQLRGLSRCRE